MYAVGKLGNYISRSVYSVSGPFHPFGGAVDIIVIEQKDGSFKSSPWYVRFGKFQGVLKAREKVVKISVNDVEAGLSMYLDSKGEAFFLRESEDGEGDFNFIPSPPTSGDETDAKTKNGQLENAQILEVESSWKEPVTQLEIENGKSVTRTNSRRSKIFGMMFGGKAMKDSASGSIERVSSLDSAEIAADLLELKWSTNIRFSERERGDNSREEPPEEMNLSSVNPEQILQSRLLPDRSDEAIDSHDEGNDDDDKDVGRSNLRTACLEEAGDYYSPRISFDEDVVEIYTLQDDNFANSIKLMSDRVSIDRTSTIDAQISNLSIVNTLNDSEGQGDIHTNLMVTEEIVQERSSHDTVAVKSEVTYGLVAIEKEEDEVHNHGSASCPVNAVQSLDENHGHTTIGTRENELKSFPEAIGSSSTPSDLPGNEVTGYEIPSIKPGHCKTSPQVIGHQSEMISELSSPFKLDGLACQESNSSKMEISGVSRVDDYSVSTSQSGDCNGPFDDSVANALNFKLHPDATESDSMMKESAVERGTNLKEMFGTDSQIGEWKTMNLGSFSGSASPNLPYSIGSAVSQNSDICIASFNTISKPPGEKCSVEIGDLKSSSFGVNINPKTDDGSKLEETVESCLSSSKNMEDIQFLFTEDESFGANGSACELQKNDTIRETEVQILAIEGDVKEQGVKDLDDEQIQEGNSDALRSHSSPINIPVCKKSSDRNELLARSLPIFVSSISEFEESYVQHLSSSLDAKSHMYQMNMLEKEHTSSLKQEVEFESNYESAKHAFDSTDTDVAAESSREQKATSSNPTIELSLSKHLLVKGMGAEPARQAFDSEKEHISEPQSRIAVEGDGMNVKLNPRRANSSPEGSWSLWPFGLRRTRTISTIQPPRENANKEEDIGNSSRGSSMSRLKSRRMARMLMPTSEELASLNLKEGRNVVTFTFSTPMLGLQQVDARIYLWKWNTRIVISDVDGTITRSDVLGQFMPLVGMDWSQTGVAHLYSAIKENGYQFIFLSARAISQAHLTRQFLFNLKQDGKALPDGPVVISPDGLFPSLYREVIRRAPHEFKISCLEAIKALFPSDCNPFYAGFGNRDTDELSYLKVGIPLGKIFIINPKGQVAVNRQINTKSYKKIHELVNAMFPPMTSDEQEDYNSWKYWRMPLPDIKI